MESNQTLRDISTGPDWILWVIIVIFVILVVVLLTGHGVGMIAGYNTASKEEQSKYDAKKLCRVTGAGLALITFLLLVMAIWEDVLPAAFANVFGAVTIIDCIVMIILMNTICKK